MNKKVKVLWHLILLHENNESRRCKAAYKINLMLKPRFKWHFLWTKKNEAKYVPFNSIVKLIFDRNNLYQIDASYSIIAPGSMFLDLILLL